MKIPNKMFIHGFSRWTETTKQVAHNSLASTSMQHKFTGLRSQLACLLVALCCIFFTSPASALHILLSNDDGYDAPGIVAIKEALKKAGHRLTVVAPDRSYSGHSALISFGPIEVKEQAKDDFILNASPATCVIWALDVMDTAGHPPDLVISGINRGANLGPWVQVSGTVSAASMAVKRTPMLPAIAISTDPFTREKGTAVNLKHYREVALFMVDLVEQLTKRDGGQLMPMGTVLNVNYPSRSTSQVKGVKMTRQAPDAGLTLKYVKRSPSLYVPDMQIKEVEGPADNDSVAHQQGYITITALSFDFTSHNPQSLALVRKLANIMTRDFQ